MKTANSIDMLLLRKFQKASDWMQDQFGFNNFDIARFLRIVMIISFIIREALSFFKGIEASEMVIIACSLMVIIKTELLLFRAQQSVKSNPGFINPAASDYAVTRLMMQFVGVAAFGLMVKHLYYIINPSINLAEQFNQWKEFFWDLFGTLMFFVVYFTSCTPKPYKPSKARKLIEQATDRIRESVVTPVLSLERLK